MASVAAAALETRDATANTAGNSPSRGARASAEAADGVSDATGAAAGGTSRGASLSPALPLPGDTRAERDEAAGAQLWASLADAHCHPQLDPSNLRVAAALRPSHIAAMAVAHDVDWHHVEALARLAGTKVIPGFGIHPWWAHLHSSNVGDTWEQLLEGKPEQVAAALQVLQAAGAQRQPGDPGGAPAAPAAPLRVVPAAEWRASLDAALRRHPGAVVGEIGLDRAATIPGTRARTSLAHQLALLREQLGVAAAAARPVSVHCVRCYGHLLQLFSGLEPHQVPPAVMLHSFGGSPDEIPKFCGLRRGGVGTRFYFSFSAAINSRTPEKLAARIAAVPSDRLLLESDQVTPLLVEPGLMDMLRTVARVRGWSLQEAAQQTYANFTAFYATSLAAMREAEPAAPSQGAS